MVQRYNRTRHMAGPSLSNMPPSHHTRCVMKDTETAVCEGDAPVAPHPARLPRSPTPRILCTLVQGCQTRWAPLCFLCTLVQGCRTRWAPKPRMRSESQAGALQGQHPVPSCRGSERAPSLNLDMRQAPCKAAGSPAPNARPLHVGYLSQPSRISESG